MYVLRDKKYQFIISTHKTIEEAQHDLEMYERLDMADGLYEEDFYEIVPSNLKLVRMSLEMKQPTLSKLSGVNYRRIQDYEQGVKDINKAPIEEIQALARVLKCEVKDILGTT